MIKYVILFTIFFISSFLFSQRGKDGDVIVSVQEEWLNTYTFLIADVSQDDISVSVNDNSLIGGMFSEPLSQGDLVLIIQMQGADVDVETFGVENWGGTYTTQTSWDGFGQGGTQSAWLQNEFGQVLNYNNSGNYEQLEVESVSGLNEIIFTCPLSYSYTAEHHVQIVRVPRISNLTLLNNSSITCPLWDGATGGIISLEVNGNLLLNDNAEISASAKGFRGGVTNNVSAFAPDPSGQGFLGSFDIREGSEKGESIFGFYTEYESVYSRYCRGALANGGGGANYHNAGGGGGSNVGSGVFTGYGNPARGANDEYVNAWNLENPNLLSNPSPGGGRGGYSHVDQNNNALSTAPVSSVWGGDFRRIAGGVGGHALAYDESRVFMGGGGGAGDMNDNQGGSGGRGGGIVFISVYAEISGEGTISANGQNGENSEGGNPSFTGKTGDDGAGGAGGGGSILFKHYYPIPNQVSLEVIGGRGGNQVLRLGALAPSQADGPGAGGAGGLIRTSLIHSEVFVNGGLAGTTNSSFMSEFPFNGATGGGSGLYFSDMPFYDLVAVDDTVCGGGEITINVDVVGDLPIGSQISWYANQYDNSPFHQGNSYTTPVLTENTTYYVGVCPGTFRKPINVLVSPSIEISGSAIIVDETCQGMDGSIEGFTVTGGFGNLVYEWNGAQYPSPSISEINGGEYVLTVIDENGCEESVGPFTVEPSPGPEINIDNIIITHETCSGNDGSITGIVVQGDDISYFWNGVNFSSTDLLNASSGSYIFEAIDEDGCISSVGPFEIDTEGGPIVDTSNLVITNESCFGGDGAITGIVTVGDNLTYEWNGIVQTDLDLENIVAGEYLLVVTDENNCSSIVGPFLIEQAEGPIVNDNNVIVLPAECGEDNGSISGISVEGEGLSYYWNGVSYATLDLVNLPAGSYVLRVEDENGCHVESGPYLVGSSGGPTIDTSQMVLVNASCGNDDGQISGILAEGDNLIFEWNGVPSNSIDVVGLEPGEYVLVTIDAQGCETSVGPFIIEGSDDPIIIDDNLEIIPATCSGGDGAIIGLNVTGDNVRLFWNGVEMDSVDINNLVSGNYNLVVVDENLCSQSYGPILIETATPFDVWVTPEFSLIDAGENVQIELDVEDGGEIVSASWSPQTRLSCSNCTNPIASPITTTEYTVLVSTSDGCSRELTVIIEVEAVCGDLYLPSNFSPNNDGVNDVLCVFGGCVEEFDLQIYSRWGELIFFTDNPEECWDGTYNGKSLNTAVYVFQLIAKLTDGTEIAKNGNINLVR